MLACRLKTSANAACPSTFTAMPPPKSRYSFPSASHTREPLPRTKTSGCRPYVGITNLSNKEIVSLAVIVPASCEARHGVASFLREPLRATAAEGIGCERIAVKLRDQLRHGS